MAKSDHKSVELKIDPVMEKPWQRVKRFEQYDYYRKSAYPPMKIEPLPEERNRIAGEGMTPEQRALRKQWVQDQILHHEVRNVPEVQPYNIFRRIYRWPADTFIYKPIKSAFGHNTADLYRYTIPKVIMAFIGSYFVWYHLKYHQNDWTRTGGFVVSQSKPPLYGDEAHNAPYERKTDFYDRGFQSRKALLPQD